MRLGGTVQAAALPLGAIAGKAETGEAYNDNFGELIFRSSTFNQIITTLDDPTTGVNKNGSLAGNTIAFQNGDKVFSFQILSSGGLNWTAAGGALC
jgi:hypothetical protein